MKAVLENSYIGRLLLNPTIIAEFPFFITKVQTRTCCGRVCSDLPDFEHIRKSVVALPDDRKARFKEILQAEEVLVHYNDNGQVKIAQF